MKTIRVSLILFILLAWAVQARTEGLSVKSLPVSGKSLTDFLPKGWAVEDQASGDLNGDGVSDIAAILVQSQPGRTQSEEDELSHAFIVLLGQDKKGFTLAGMNDKLLQCKGCGGVKEGIEIAIKKGVIVVVQHSGSREFTDETYRFRLDPQTQRFVIIGRDLESGDSARGTGTTVSFNYLTGQKITQNYRYDKSGEHKNVTSTKKEDDPRRTVFIEDVKPIN